MIRFTTSIFVFILFSLPVSSGFCQGQPGQLDILTGKFINYCHSVPWEEVYVHTDRGDYIAGEVLWFNVYLIDRQSANPSLFSKIVYLEVLNPDNRPVVRRRIEVENGSGPGQVTLPDSLSSGIYTLRAYTNWMKNFLPANCFMKKINVYNSLSNREYTIKPGAGTASTDIATGTGLAESWAKDFNLTINENDPDNLELSVSADESFILKNGNLCYFIIQTRGNISYTGSLLVSGNRQSIFIPQLNLVPGINQVTFFSSAGKPVYERFIYIPANDKSKISLSISGDLRVREHIFLEIETSIGTDPSPYEGNLSISVSPVTDLPYDEDIKDYLIFGSEFGILPDSLLDRKISEILRDKLNEFLLTLKSSWIDWNAIVSENLPDCMYKFERENHFITGRLVERGTNLPDTGKYIFLSTPGKVASFHYAKTDAKGKFSFVLPITDVSQDIIIQPEETSKNNTIILGSSFSEEFVRLKNTHFLINSNKIPPYISKWSINYQISKIYQTTSIGNTVRLSGTLPAVKRFYGKPDVELIMDDYIRLPVMQEVFFELIPGVSLKNKRSAYEFSIGGPSENVTYFKPPGLLIDGVQIYDPSVIAGLDPELVEKIDVVKELYMVDEYLFYGLINVITRRGDFSCVSLPDNAVRLQYRVVDQLYNFSAPDYSTSEKKQSRIPDFRNTLYWNPAVKPDSAGKIMIDFWASDYASDYVINIQGLTREGDVVSSVKVFKIE